MDSRLFGDPESLFYLMEGLNMDEVTEVSSTTLTFGNSPTVSQQPPVLPPCPLYTWDLFSGRPTPPSGHRSNSPVLPQLEKQQTTHDFSSNGVEADLTEQDVYQLDLRRNYALHDDVVNSGREQEAGGKNLNRLHQRPYSYKSTVCVFCKNNGENLSVYGSHSLKDNFGRVTCPILQRYVCPVCGASGSEAHTLKYCPFNATYKEDRISYGVTKKPRHPKGKKHRMG